MTVSTSHSRKGWGRGVGGVLSQSEESDPVSVRQYRKSCALSSIFRSNAVHCLGVVVVMVVFFWVVFVFVFYIATQFTIRFTNLNIKYTLHICHSLPLGASYLTQGHIGMLTSPYFMVGRWLPQHTYLQQPQWGDLQREPHPLWKNH